MAIRKLVHDGTELTAVAQTLLTFGDNLVEGGAVLMLVTFVNKDSIAHRVTAHLVAEGASPSESNCIFDRIVPAQRNRQVAGPFHANSLAYVSALSDDANSSVSARVTALEERGVS